MKSVKVILIIGAVALITCCSPKLFTPTAIEIQRAQQFTADADSTYLIQGRELYINKCGSCHYLYKPEMFSAQKWKHEMVEMQNEAKLNEEEFNKVRTYLLTFAKSETRN